MPGTGNEEHSCPATNPDRARPYLSADYVVNRYPEAVPEKYGKDLKDLPWGIRVRDPGTMERITVDDVTSLLDRLLQAQGNTDCMTR